METRIRTCRSGPFRYFTCSCGRYQAVNEIMPWCAGCFEECDVTPRGVTLRPGRKTPRFAFAKAFGRAGGARIGPDPSP